MTLGVNKKMTAKNQGGRIINIMICDDDKQALEIISEYVYNIAEIFNISFEIYLYSNGKNVIEALNNPDENFDILFLDVDMPEISGIEVAKNIRKNERDIILIFVSAHEQYVFEAIEYQPFRYIRKSRLEKELKPALKAAYNKIQSENITRLVIKTEDGEELYLKHKDIMYFELYARKITAYINDGREIRFSGRKTIKKLCEELDDDNFVRVNSGCIVNIRYISNYSAHDVTLDDGTKLIVSRVRMKDIKKMMTRYWGERV